jgi:chitooligosaccharide deacetylase
LVCVVFFDHSKFIRSQTSAVSHRIVRGCFVGLRKPKNMLIQIFGAVWVLGLYFLGVSGWFALIMILGAFAVAMAPPRIVLDKLAEASGGLVYFRFNTKPDGGEGDATATIPVHVTIDDAPSAHTFLILDALAQIESHRAVATWFVIGQNAKSNPDVLKQIVAVGHRVANHDFQDRLTASVGGGDATKIAAELTNTETEIRTILELPTAAAANKTDRKSVAAGEVSPFVQWFRPGCGLYTPAVLSAARSCGYRVLLGDTYGHDPMLAWFPQLLNWFYRWRVFFNGAGSVLILHDGTRQRCANSADVLRFIAAADPRIRFVPLPPTHSLPPPARA